MKIFGKLVDVHSRIVFNAGITIENGIIKDIQKLDSEYSNYILPAFTDAHIHIESSMITPSAFAFQAVKHGTVACVSDPHEIANVCGLDGVEFMIRDGKKVPFKFYFGAPSCVPATTYETSGAVLNSDEIRKLLLREDVKYLSEVMNFPGVIYKEKEVISKISSAKMMNKPVDGHAPGLTGNALKEYVSAGISTDHECSNLYEAEEKISLGMKIIIREGSAAKNLNSLKSLIGKHADKVMLCSDDLHPEMLMRGHINILIRKLLKEGFDLFDVLRCATVNPVEHYKLEIGLLRKGDPADFIIVDNLEEMNIMETWINGTKVYGNNEVLFSVERAERINNFKATAVSCDEIVIRKKGNRLRLIEAFEGELLTKEHFIDAGQSEIVKQETKKDILKIVLKDRYNNGKPSCGFVKGFNLKKGAFASSVAHDSHNIICVGANDYDIVTAINEIIRLEGGLAISCENRVDSLQLDIAGIMSSDPCDQVASGYEELNKIVMKMGCKMTSPFMTLAFMALLVIPELKIGDKGLFDVRTFQPVSLFC